MEDDEELLPIDDEDETSEEKFRDMDTNVELDREESETGLSDSFFFGINGSGISSLVSTL